MSTVDAGALTLEGQVALVTGSAQGMGFAIARALRAAGATVALSDLSEEALRKAEVAIGASGDDNEVQARQIRLRSRG